MHFGDTLVSPACILHPTKSVLFTMGNIAVHCTAYYRINKTTGLRKLCKHDSGHKGRQNLKL
jgi:hypothetical protein